ncbi:hypothetical protein BCONGLO52_22490 [Brachybacterium conglomeratum]|uniref:HTH hxlR-type domain-containing protein n=2 Tax=Brachybacterium TaxID=43668 RepID=A0A3R8QVK3_9MICO|nr:hypothetical protein DS079_05645 [Brachybacterium paraconglomeratum]GLI31408.1 hypothetical protein BCONGLO52_22490 [Brachybacterium conglomeratum]GLK04320.1 hypothetical protein GCM10017597_11190 [Brachybacterium conglomeratum]
MTPRDPLQDGVVARTDRETVPPRVDYELTELGHALAPVVEAMNRWGADYAAALPPRG